jgi:hypothetical protein
VTVPAEPQPSVPSVPGPLSNQSPLTCCDAQSPCPSLAWLLTMIRTPTFAAATAVRSIIARSWSMLALKNETRTQLKPATVKASICAS